MEHMNPFLGKGDEEGAKGFLRGWHISNEAKWKWFINLWRAGVLGSRTGLSKDRSWEEFEDTAERKLRKSFKAPGSRPWYRKTFCWCHWFAWVYLRECWKVEGNLMLNGKGITYYLIKLRTRYVWTYDLKESIRPRLSGDLVPFMERTEVCPLWSWILFLLLFLVDLNL